MSNTGFIQRLLRDRKANVMAIGAASILPMIGVVGGGVDASRLYLAKSRLQQACDSATLAARKKLAGSSVTAGVIPANITQTADNFFEANFPAGMYGTTNVSYTLAAGTATRMDGAASADVPTTLMKVFNVPTVSISATCSAELNLPNIDVMLVLDNSGSMRNSRIAGLKTAVFSFYDELMAAKPAGTRIRIGLVPYSNTVNVGAVLTDPISGNPAWLRDNTVYQSREAITEPFMIDPGSPGSPAIPAVPATPGTPDTEEEYSNQREYIPTNRANLGSGTFSHYRWKTDSNSNNNGSKECDRVDGTYTVGSEKWVITNSQYYGYWWSNYYSDRGACIANMQKFRVIPGEPGTPGTPGVPAVPPTPPTYEDRFKEYRYKPLSFDTSQFKRFNTVTEQVGTGFQGAKVTDTWGGCIEEVKTVASATYDPIPAGALDLDIDIVPDPADPDTQWAPFWPKVTFDRNAPAERTTTAELTNEYHYDCPVRSYKLQEWPLNGTERNSAFKDAVNSMVASGFTMHDIGMIWAGRFLSPNGIFAADNAVAPNGDPVSRHILFMTDGQMEPGPDSYHAYGDYDVEGRINGFAADGTWETADIGVFHSRRLAAICNIIKNKNITIWSVAFELDHTDFTRDCATGGASRAYKADNNAELIARFKEIATSIAELRLTK